MRGLCVDYFSWSGSGTHAARRCPSEIYKGSGGKWRGIRPGLADAGDLETVKRPALCRAFHLFKSGGEGI